MGSGDGQVLGTTKIVDRGPDNQCFNIVLVAEGYKAGEQDQFNQNCDDFVNAFNNLLPFTDCGGGVNFHRINVSSTDSGADDPTSCQGGTGATAKTYLDASFCDSGIRRLMSFNTSLALQVLNQQVPAWHQALIIVNSTIYGGAGGSLAITSLGGNWVQVAIHEFAHAAFGLADEYECWQGCQYTEPSQNYHSSVEPIEPNVTTKKQRDQIKWRQMILPTTPVPTTANNDCTKCDTQPDPMPSGTIGLYEGAHYCHCNAYRPAFNCMMYNLSAFCKVCESIIRQKLSPYAQQADLAITPWGYAQSPPKPPWWQTPDIWGTPVVGKANNDLHIRVRNDGSASSPSFKVRASFVPFTTLIDMKNEILIDKVNRPALGSGGIDEFVVNWDLSPAKLPSQYAKFNHFCVIAQIETSECNTTNNQAQNNFVDVPSTSTGPPPPLRFEIANPWRKGAIASLLLKTSDKRLRLQAKGFSPDGIKLEPRERRVVEVILSLTSRRITEGKKPQFEETYPRFEITQLLDGQIVGGLSGVVKQRLRR